MWVYLFICLSLVLIEANPRTTSCCEFVIVNVVVDGLVWFDTLLFSRTVVGKVKQASKDREQEQIGSWNEWMNEWMNEAPLAGPSTEILFSYLLCFPFQIQCWLGLGVIIPLVSQPAVNGKITFLERVGEICNTPKHLLTASQFGTEPANNSTGAY